MGMQISSSVPNIISISRLFLAPAAVWRMILGDFVTAFWIFFIAATSDAVDGIIARKFNAQSELGTYLDPLADKTLLVSIYVMLGVGGLLPVWLVILVVFRDVVLVGGVILTLVTEDEPYKVHPSFISKVNTTVQITLAACVLYVAAYGQVGEWFVDGSLREVLIYLTAATTVASGTIYVLRWVFKSDEGK